MFVKKKKIDKYFDDYLPIFIIEKEKHSVFN